LKFYNETIKEIKEYSVFYNKLINPSKEIDKEINKELKYINRLEINVSFPFLLPVYNDYNNGVIDKEIFIKILKLVQSYTWRRFIVGLPTNALNKIFMNLYSDIVNSNYYTSLEKTLVRKKGVQKFPTNKEIEIALAEKDVYNVQSKNRVYLLELLENYNNKEYVSIDNPDITIEHIFPQNPDEKWYDVLDENSIKEIQEKYLNTIANLTLSGNNGSLGNKLFADKKVLNKDGKEQGYAYSNLKLNQYLKGINEWNIDHLQKRYSILLERFLKIWKFPEVEIEEDEIDVDEDYNIYNAPDPRHKKLDYFIFKDEKIETEEVAKMYYHVVKVLFEENPSAFNHHELKTLLGLSTDSNTLRTPYQLNSSYFIEANIDNNSKFRKLKSLLSQFNYEDELIINFSNKEEDELESEEKNRAYWDKKASLESLSVVDECMKLINEIDDKLTLNYTQSYIAPTKGDKRYNFALFVPKQIFVRALVTVDDPVVWAEKIESVGFKVLSIGKKSNRIRFRIDKEKVKNRREDLLSIFKASYQDWVCKIQHKL
jgi:hypothetical protein